MARKQIKVNKTNPGGMGLYAKNEAPDKPRKPAAKAPANGKKA